MLVQIPCKTPASIAAASLLAFSPALFAASTATVSALQPAAWLQQGDRIQMLEVGDSIASGERIITGDNGRIEVRIEDRFSLQQNTGSDIMLQVSAGDDQSEPDLLVQAGRACIEVHRTSGDNRQLVVALGTTMTMTLHDEGKICVLHQDGLSSVHLQEGSIQIVHAVDSNIIVLSESGSEFQVEFGESYSVLLPEEGQAYQLASEGFPIPEALPQQPIEPEPEVEVAESEAVAEPEVETTVEAISLEGTASDAEASPVEKSVVSYDSSSKYVYKVYLFSTRDEEVAEEVNQRFHRAGIPSQIFTRESDGSTRFRIVVTGFSSLAAANEYSESIIGKHGISDTWIERNQREAAE